MYTCQQILVNVSMCTIISEAEVITELWPVHMHMHMFVLHKHALFRPFPDFISCTLKFYLTAKPDGTMDLSAPETRVPSSLDNNWPLI